MEFINNHKQKAIDLETKRFLVSEYSIMNHRYLTLLVLRKKDER
jgi:hypothetical protein